jgi:hypothetical protein
MPDPVARLEFAVNEIDRVLGAGFSVAHPELVGIVMQSATADWCAARLAVAIEQVAMALAEPEVVPVRRSMLRQS